MHIHIHTHTRERAQFERETMERIYRTYAHTDAHIDEARKRGKNVMLLLWLLFITYIWPECSVAASKQHTIHRLSSIANTLSLSLSSYTITTESQLFVSRHSFLSLSLCVERTNERKEKKKKKS